MATYTDEQRGLLLDAAAEVLVAAVAAERTGPVQYFREILAAGRYLYDARRRYRDNQLVQQVFAHAEEREVALDEVTRERMLAHVEQIAATVHDDDEGREFKRFLYELAERVAMASREGLFGRRLSDDEARFLQDLHRRLALPDT